jgi:hypothetical protein
MLTGGTTHWAGIPNPEIIFHSDDWVAIPFSLVWGGLMIFWEAGALGTSANCSKTGNGDVFMILWGIPFVLCGQYLIWGRFFHDAWLKRRTFYAVTNRRVLAPQDGWYSQTTMQFSTLSPESSARAIRTGHSGSVRNTQLSAAEDPEKEA